MTLTDAIEITDEQRKTLVKLAKAQAAAKEATALRAQLAGFVQDNEAALKYGVTVDGLRLGVKISRQLTAELAA